MLALSAPASAHHTNPSCQGGNFNQTWTGPTTFFGFALFQNDCILVEGDIRVEPGNTVTFRDVQLVFANNITNVTIHLGMGSVWEMRNNSRLEVWNLFNTSEGFWFNASGGSSVYINDTIILGGGTPGNGITPMGGLYFDSLNDFAWNRVEHTPLGPDIFGLALINYHNQTDITNYTVRNGGIGIYLGNTSSINVFDFATQGNAIAAMVNDSFDIGFYRASTTAIDTGLIVNNGVGFTVEDFSSTRHSDTGIALNVLSNAALRRVHLNPLRNAARYGLHIDACTDVSLTDADMSEHLLADLHVKGLTQDLTVLNLTIRNAQRGYGIWVEDSGSPINSSRFTFRNMLVSGKGAMSFLAQAQVLLVGTAFVLFENTTITAGSFAGTRGLYLQACYEVRFTNGSITLNPAGGAYLDGSNLTIDHSAITQNAQGAAVDVGGGSFILDRVDLVGNALSVRTLHATGSTAVVLTGPSAITNSTVPGNIAGSPADAVNLTHSGGNFGVSLLVSNVTFYNAPGGLTALFGLRADGFSKIEVYNSTFQSLAVSILRTNTLVMAGNVHQVSRMAAGFVAISFDTGSAVNLSGELFPLPAPTQPLAAALRATNILTSVEVTDVRFPRADNGIVVVGTPSGFVSRAVLRNVTVGARGDGISIVGIRVVTLDRVTVDLSRNAVIATDGGTSSMITVRDSLLQANTTGMRLRVDSAGSITVTNVTFNATGGLPSVGLNLSGGATVVLARITLDRIPTAIYVSEARRILLTRLNFTNNSVLGFGMYAPSGNGSLLNWTVDTPTSVIFSSLRLNGEVTVAGVAFTLRSADVSIFASNAESAPTRFYFQGASVLTIASNASILAEAANFSRGLRPANFTLEFSPSARLILSDATLRGLGVRAATEPTQLGLLLRAENVAVTNVLFIDGQRPLQAEGVEIDVVDCVFRGTSPYAAVTVTAGGVARLLRVTVDGLDGVDARNAETFVDDSNISNAGAAVLLFSARATLRNTSVLTSSAVVSADANSSAYVYRVAAGYTGTNFVARGGSAINVFDSNLTSASWDAEASGGGTVTLENTVVDRTKPDGSRLYNTRALIPSTIQVFWRVQFGVCLLSTGLPTPDATVTVSDAYGAAAFSGVTGPDGRTLAGRLLEYENRSATQTYYSPFGVYALLGNLAQAAPYSPRDASDFTVCLDDIPPEVNVISPTFDLITGTNFITFSGSAIDRESGLAPGYPCVKFNEEACKPSPPTFQISRALREGANTFRIIAEDVFGNHVEVVRVVTLDTTAPVFESCTPPDRYKTRDPVVQLTCTISGAPVRAVFAGVAASDAILSPNGTLTATITLSESCCTFTISVNDSVGNIGSIQRSWTLDTQPPAPQILSRINGTVINPTYFLNGRLASDTARVVFNANALTFSNNSINARWELTEGLNNATLVITDDVGNVWQTTFWLILDTTTNCELATPNSGDTFTREPVWFGGSCDGDVTISISRLPDPVHPGPDGRWQVQVALERGLNVVEITATDSHGATWFKEVRVTYEPSTESSGLLILVIFAIAAAALFGLAFLILRRPHRREGTQAPRPRADALEAPPRPKPHTTKLPEVPPDQTYQPRVPPPPPPPPR